MHQVSSEKGSTLKRNKMLPSGANVFLIESTFSEVMQKQILQSCLSRKNVILLLKQTQEFLKMIKRKVQGVPQSQPASVAQLDARLTGDQEVSFMEISLPSADSRRAVVSL